MTLPVSHAPAPAPARQAVVLIVDDAPANLGALRKAMIQQGHQVFVATSGARALAIAGRAYPDLILLDIVMPGMDGLDLCRQLKASPATQRIPVIFMSARTATEDIVAGFDAGAADYIPKPLRLAEVCARVRAQLQIRSSSQSHQDQAEHLRMIVNGMAEGLLVIEPNGRIQYSNPAGERYLGYAPHQLAGHSLVELLGAPVARDYLDYFAACAADPAGAQHHGTREVVIRHRDGALRAMDLTLTPMNGAQPLFIALLHDITHHKQSATALQRAALVDSLTKIANRRHFDMFLEKEWQRAVRSCQPMSLIVLDVDHFKLYNDSHGHAAGDLCLQQVAAALASHALRTTDLAARYGGEEFVLLFAETPAAQAVRLAESIRKHIESLQLRHARSPSSEWVTVSIGVATIVPTQLDQIETFFVAADRMMYAAKEAGRNRVESADAGNARWDGLKARVMG